MSFMTKLTSNSFIYSLDDTWHHYLTAFSNKHWKNYSIGAPNIQSSIQGIIFYTAIYVYDIPDIGNVYTNSVTELKKFSKPFLTKYSTYQRIKRFCWKNY